MQGLVLTSALAAFLALAAAAPQNDGISFIQRQVLALKRRESKAVIMYTDIWWKLEYMYEPAVSTLRAGFESRGGWTVEVPTPVGKDEIAEHVSAQVADMQSGDIFVWVGWGELNAFVDAIPNMKEKGIRTVYYNADPIDDCQLKGDVVDEQWDFSLKNIAACAKAADAPVLRFVPLGALETVRAVHTDDPGSLSFFGHVNGARVDCYDKLAAQIPMTNDADVWNDEGFASLLSSRAIYLNMNHECDLNDDFDPPRRQPVFWRVPKLLNAHALVISEPCYEEDAAVFDGLVDFVAFNDIPAKYNEIAAMSGAQRKQLADSRAAEFTTRFAPAKIFEEAGVYALMDACASGKCAAGAGAAQA